MIAHGTIGDLQKGEGDSGKESETRQRKEGMVLAQTDKLAPPPTCMKGRHKPIPPSAKGEHSETGRQGGMILATVRLRL